MWRRAPAKPNANMNDEMKIILDYLQGHLKRRENESVQNEEIVLEEAMRGSTKIIGEKYTESE